MNNLNASFIFPANDKDLAKKLRKNVNAKFKGVETIPLFNTTSFFDAWRKGLKKSKSKYLILTHQDVEFLSIPDLEKIVTDCPMTIG